MSGREDRVPIIYDDQINIRNTTNATNSSTGALNVTGGISVQKAAYIGDNVSVQGNVSINSVDITPNLNDIILEQQATLLADQNEFINVANFYFDNNIASSFKANVNVHVTGSETKFALWEINGILQNGTWVIASTFTGDLTGVQFRITDDEGVGRIQYTNSNGAGTNTYIRFRATTTAPPGTNTQYGESIIQNNSMNFIQNGFLYASSADTLATSTDLMIKSGTIELANPKTLVIKNTSNATDVGSSGSLIVDGGVSVGKDVYVGGDINVSGDLFKNGTLIGDKWDASGTDILYTLGNVGVGSSAPSARLDVAGDLKVSDGLIAFGNSNTLGSLITTGGNIGIGTTQPNANSTLHISSNTSTNLVISGATYNETGGVGILFQNDDLGSLQNVQRYKTQILAVGNGYYGQSDLHFLLNDSYDVNNATLSDTRMIIKKDGNVGIGTTVPNAKLDVDGGILAKSLNIYESLVNSNIRIQTNNINQILDIGSEIEGEQRHYLYGYGDYSLVLGTNATERMRINSSGNVGIGTANPTAKLHVFADNSYLLYPTSPSIVEFRGSTTSPTPETIFRIGRGISPNYAFGASVEFQVYRGYEGNNSANTGFDIRLGAGNSDGPDTSIMTLFANGKVGINTTSPNANLDVNGTMLTKSLKISDTTEATTTSTGALIVSGGVGVSGKIHANEAHLGTTVISGDLTVTGSTITLQSETQVINDNLLVLNAGPDGLYDSGLMINLTSGSYATMFYDSDTEHFHFAHTSSDPGAASVVVDHYIGLRGYHIDIVGTDQATGLGTGGSLTALGGASIQKDVYVGGVVDVTERIKYGEASLFSNLATAGNNVVSATDVLGLQLSGTSRSFQSQVLVSVSRSAGGDLHELFTLQGINTASGWVLFSSSVGDMSGLSFTITSQGQVQYTSSNLENFTSATVKFSVSEL